TLDDGRSVEVYFWEKDGKLLSRFSMRLDEAAARATLERRAEVAAAGSAEGGSPEGEAAADAAPAIDMEAELAKLRDQVEQFERSYGEWVYALPAYKASNLRKSFEDYLKSKG